MCFKFKKIKIRNRFYRICSLFILQPSNWSTGRETAGKTSPPSLDSGRTHTRSPDNRSLHHAWNSSDTPNFSFTSVDRKPFIWKQPVSITRCLTSSFPVKFNKPKFRTSKSPLWGRRAGGRETLRLCSHCSHCRFWTICIWFNTTQQRSVYCFTPLVSVWFFIRSGTRERPLWLLKAPFRLGNTGAMWGRNFLPPFGHFGMEKLQWCPRKKSSIVQFK